MGIRYDHGLCSYVFKHYHEVHLSLSTIVLNSRNQQGMYGMQHFCTSRNPPYNRLEPIKTDLNALVWIWIWI